MFLGAYRTCVVASPGWEEILGQRSTVFSSSSVVAAEGVGWKDTADVLNVDGRRVGRRVGNEENDLYPCVN